MAILAEFEGRRPRVAESAFLAPTAVLIGDVEVGERASIWFGAVLRGDIARIRIRNECNIQDKVVIHAETTEGTVLDERVTVDHGAILHDCWIGKDCLIGMGAILLDRSRVGAGSLVGAGEGRGLFQDRKLILTIGATASYRLRKQMPDGIAIGAHGPYGVLVEDRDTPLNKWFVKAYKERYGADPLESAYHYAQSVLAVKAAYDKAAKATGSAPSVDDVVKAFAGMEFESITTTIRMSLNKGHQAVRAGRPSRTSSFILPTASCLRKA